MAAMRSWGGAASPALLRRALVDDRTAARGAAPRPAAAAIGPGRGVRLRHGLIVGFLVAASFAVRAMAFRVRGIVRGDPGWFLRALGRGFRSGGIVIGASDVSFAVSHEFSHV